MPPKEVAFKLNGEGGEYREKEVLTFPTVLFYLRTHPPFPAWLFLATVLSECRLRCLGKGFGKIQLPLRPGAVRPREERQGAAGLGGGVESQDSGFPERLLES